MNSINNARRDLKVRNKKRKYPLTIKLIGCISYRYYNVRQLKMTKVFTYTMKKKD